MNPAVDWVTLQLRPIARCDDCGWHPFFYGNDARDAKAHARAFPGHHVTVDKITRTEYFVRAQA